MSINDTVAGTGADAWATGVMSQNQSSLNNTTHIIENRYKNDGSGQETDSYANLSATLPFYINNPSSSYDGTKDFSRSAKIMVKFDGSNNLESVSVIDAGAGYKNINDLSIKAKTGNTYNINNANDIAMLNFNSGSITNIVSETEALGKKYDPGSTITIEGPTASLPTYFNNASKNASAILVLDDVTKLENEISFDVVDSFIYEDGYQDPRKIIIKPSDTDDDNVPDLPLSFENIIDNTEYVFFESYTDFDGYTYYRPVTNESTRPVVLSLIHI